MMPMRRLIARGTALAAAVVAALLPLQRAAGQTQPAHPLDIGGPPGPRTARTCLTDSMLDAAVASFNGAAAMRISGGTTTAADTFHTLASYGTVRLGGTVHGDVIVFNGDLRLTATAHVDGTITVLGGSLTVDPGAFAQGHRFECDEMAPVTRQANGTVVRRRSNRSLLDYTSGASLNVGPVQTSVRLEAGVYNRAEGLPAELHPAIAWDADAHTTVRVDGIGIVRTSNDPTGARSDFGWHARLAVIESGSVPVTFGVEGGSTVVPTADQPYSALESGLSAFLLHRDYRDWYQSDGGGVFASWDAEPHLTLSGAWNSDRETTLPGETVFSLTRNNEPWRLNPLIDDGKYHTVTLGGTWDTRDEAARPTSGLFVHAEVQHVSSNSLTPVSLPTTIRATMPNAGYGETEMNFDARLYLRLDPLQSVHLRVMGGGWLSGDPLTVQRRLANGSGDELPGYDFRAFNCDRRLRPDPALPALCDRDMAVQAEYRRTVSLNLATRIAGYSIGVRRPQLVLFGDMGSAWLAGDSAGFVPKDRIQSISEWHSDAGIGLDAGTVGLYLAKAFTAGNPIRFAVRLTPRF